MSKCFWLTVWYTLRYPRDGLLKGLVLSGHDFEGTNEVHDDHWEMKCKTCGIAAASEVRP